MSKVETYQQEIRDAIELIENCGLFSIDDQVMPYPQKEHDTIITALRAQIEPGWIKVSDRLPDWNDCRNGRVLVIFENMVIDTWNPVLIKTNLSSQLALHVTHWMPLPPAPKDGE